jgi:predicted phage baseplate assembly protein
MPILPPRLDDRAFDDLVNELVARIPAHTQEWTHAAPGDPGRTLIELFAWLADTILYRANLVPERQRLVFLKLLGQPLRPALPAQGLVSVQFDGDDLRSGTVLRPGAVVRGPVEFETRRELSVLPVTAQALYKRRLTDTEAEQLSGIVEELRSLYDLPSAQPYVTSEAFPGGRGRPEGFDLATESVDRMLWLALYAAKPEHVASVRSDLTTGAGGRPHVLSVAVTPALLVPDSFADLPELRPVPHVWEMTTGAIENGMPVYRTLDVLSDGTGGLVREGVVRLVLPGEGIGAPTNDPRVELDAGVGDRPPRVDDPARAARLVAWLRLRPTERLAALPLASVGVNGVEIDQLRTLRDRVVGQSDGRADQSVQLPSTSIDPGSLVLEVESAEQGFVSWTRVDDLATAGRDDLVYRLDSEAGTAHFGDGVRGRLPPLGSRFRVRVLRSGGGEQGNLPAELLKQITADDLAGARVQRLSVAQPMPTRGGADAETLVDAERRIPSFLRHRDRAVVEDDYREIAFSTPGLRVARVELLPRFKPHQRQSDVPGVVSVMTLPFTPGVEPPNPRPDRRFLESVHAWLDARRPLGTELYAIGAEYVPLSLSVAVDVRAGFEREQTLRDVRQALRAWLWPLAPGGPTATGWPLGTDVQELELLVPAARVPGVAAVRGIRLFVKEADRWVLASRSGNSGQLVRMRPYQLPELLRVIVVADGDAPEDLGPVPGESDGVAVPVVPAVC